MPPPVQQIRFCQSRDGTRIAYATSGTGPPLVRAAHWLTHLNLDWESPVWGPWLNLLSHRHTLVRYDARGCGLSDRDGIEFAFDKSIEDLEAVVDAHKLNRFVLFGTTAGGATALGYAARHPERVSRLILTGCYAAGRLARNPTAQQIAETEHHVAAVELGWSNENPAFRQFFTSLFIPEATSEQARSINELMRQSMSSANAAARLHTFHRYDLRELAPRVSCPTLVFHSREDARVPFEEGRTLAALIPDARFVPLESRNHWLVETEPAWQQLVEELEDFLPEPAPAIPSCLADLTTREHQVLELVAQGLDNDTIGTRLVISEKTVRNHLTTILDKLGVHSRAQAIVRAREAGLGHGSQR